jgi:hypothetical protein
MSPAKQVLHEIISDDDAPPQAQKQRPAKRRKSDDDEHVEAHHARRGSRGNVSHCFDSHAGTKANRKPAKSVEPIDLEVEEAPAQQSKLKASVMGVLGPKTSSSQAVQVQRASSSRLASPIKDVPGIDEISDDEDELHGDGDIPSSRERRTLSAVAVGPAAQRGKKTKTTESRWAVEEVVDANEVYAGFEFLDLTIHIGIAARHMKLSKPNAQPEDNLFMIPPNRIRGIQTSDNAKCRILRIRGTGENNIDIKFRNHADTMEFVKAIQHMTTMTPGNIQLDRPL